MANISIGLDASPVIASCRSIKNELDAVGITGKKLSDIDLNMVPPHLLTDIKKLIAAQKELLAMKDKASKELAKHADVAPWNLPNKQQDAVHNRKLSR